MRKKQEQTQERLEEGNETAQKAALKMIQITYDTPDDKLAELTFLPGNQVLNLSMMEAFDSLRNQKRTAGNLATAWRISYYRHLRSVKGAHLFRGVMLAESEMAKEEAEQDKGWDSP